MDLVDLDPQGGGGQEDDGGGGGHHGGQGVWSQQECGNYCQVEFSH